MSRVATRNHWLFLSALDPRARLYLFCFPYAEGAAQVFNKWQAAFTPDHPEGAFLIMLVTILYQIPAGRWLQRIDSRSDHCIANQQRKSGLSRCLVLSGEASFRRNSKQEREEL
jgi:hypothetical protein